MDIISLLLLVIYLCALIGASLACAHVLPFLLRIELENKYALPLGFAVLPVLVTYGGFLQIWNIPYLSSLITIAASIYGARVIWQFAQDCTWKKITHWWMCIIPAGAVIILFITKFAYLKAAISDGDEIRSILLTTSFATNNLKPAYPFDFSIPVAYPYYLFQTSAFLYHSARGFLFPTIPIFATTLISIGLTYYVLYLVSNYVFIKEANKKFFLVSALLTFSGFFGLNRLGEIVSFVSYQVQPISIYFHSGYHYLWGIALALWGLALLDGYFRKNEDDVWILAVFLLCLSFGSAGLAAAWAGLSAVIVVLDFMLRRGEGKIGSLVRLMPMALLVIFFTLLPQIFNFLPRFDPSFSLSAPHVWFPTDAQLFMIGKNIESLSSLFIVGPIIILTNIGPLLVIGFCFSIVAVTYAFAHRDEEWMRLRPFAIGVVVAMFLLTFTTTVKSDWYARGFLVPTFMSAFIAAKLFSAVFFRRWSASFVVFLLGVQGTSVIVEHWQHVASTPQNFEKIKQINSDYALSDVFYEKKFKQGSDIVLAGRAVISEPPISYVSFILHPNILEKIGVVSAFAPCLKSKYGQSTPLGEYISVEGNNWEKRICP